ncbi:MAG: glycosyltransferase [Pontiellaceae bacterium]|nr:glycosyltransferase [Pontiellaceae bacterium]
MSPIHEIRESQSRTEHESACRIHYDQLAPQLARGRRLGGAYQKLLQRYYRLFIPSGARVLEIGCGQGDLLHALAPVYGLGLDLAPAQLQQARRKYPELVFIELDGRELPSGEPFDYVILSDLVNELWDVQQLLEAVCRVCHRSTRIVLNFHNNLWSPVLSLARRMGLLHPVPQQNWLTPEDIRNLFALSGLEVVHHRPAMLLPLPIPLLAPLFNRVLAHLPGFRAFDLTHFYVARPAPVPMQEISVVSVIVPARNEAGNIAGLLERIPEMGAGTEIIFIEGHSSDETYAEIELQVAAHPERACRYARQTGEGKGDAVRLGFEMASGDILMILDADGTVAPEDLPRFYEALVSGRGEFINGVRLVYPLGDRSMRFWNMVGNRFFGMLFSWLLGQPVRDTLCGTKVLWKKEYEQIARDRAFFGLADPFGDFDLLFGAARANLKMLEIPIRYGARTYGDTNISRWRHGAVLLRMAAKAGFRWKLV